MGKGDRMKRLRREPKLGLKKTLSDRLTMNFQKEIRNSKIWDQMVAEFGSKVWALCL